MGRTIVTRRLVPLLLILASCSGAQEELSSKLTPDRRELTLEVDTRASLTLTGNVHGFNLANTGGAYSFTDSIFLQVVSDLRPRLLRFPGGTTASFYHWQEDGFLVDEIRAYGRDPRPFIMLEERRDGRLSFDDFMDVSLRFGIRPVLQVNLLTGSPSESAAWVAHVKKNGYDVAGWELDNELYLSRYRAYIKSVVDYIERAKAHAEAMLAVDSTVRLGVVTAPHRLSGRGENESEQMRYYRQWNEALAAENFYEAYVVHLYPGPGPAQRLGFEAARHHLFYLSETALSETIQHYRGLYGDRSLWLTEWNIGGRNNPVANTLLHAVFVGDFFIGLLQHSENVELALFHTLMSLSSTFGIVTPGEPGDASPDDPAVRRATWYTFHLIARALERATAVGDVSVVDAPTVEPPAGSDRVALAGVRAVALVGEGRVWILVSNRTPTSLPVRVVVDGATARHTTRYSHIWSPNLAAPPAGREGSQGFGAEPFRIEVRELPADALQLPANSFGVIELMQSRTQWP